VQSLSPSHVLTTTQILYEGREHKKVRKLFRTNLLHLQQGILYVQFDVYVLYFIKKLELAIYSLNISPNALGNNQI